MASEHFLNMAVHLTQKFLLVGKMLLRLFNDHHHCHRRNGQHNQRDKRQLPAYRKHHDEDTDDRRNGCDDLSETLV
ncbi:hypothetical protein SDC9_211008 [bioreactor metagenome]|uniref:Uncharacterized protein n=1 Tax=bioreactor metagenome TaxID=1076179 RepID=A0A645JI04_9ZZZZ